METGKQRKKQTTFTEATEKSSRAIIITISGYCDAYWFIEPLNFRGFVYEHFVLLNAHGVLERVEKYRVKMFTGQKSMIYVGFSIGNIYFIALGIVYNCKWYVQEFKETTEEYFGKWKMNFLCLEMGEGGGGGQGDIIDFIMTFPFPIRLVWCWTYKKICRDRKETAKLLELYFIMFYWAKTHFRWRWVS